MGDPGAIAPVSHFAQLVSTHFGNGRVIGRHIILDRNLRSHATHGRRTAAVTCLHQPKCIGTHEWCGHGDLGAVGQAEIGVRSEFLDAGENVIPATDVQTGRMIAQFPQELVHLERGHHRLDQAGALDAAMTQAQFGLGLIEHIVPQPCLEM